VKRIDHVTKATDLHGSGKHGYTDGSASLQVAPSVVNASQMNPLQEEIARAAEAVLGVGACTGGYGQLVAAMLGATDALAASQAALGVDVGAAAITDAESDGQSLLLTRSATSNQVYYKSLDATSFSSTSLASASTNGINAIASNPQGTVRFVLVGAGGEIQSSDSSLSLTKRTQAAPFVGAFRSVCYADDLDLWCAVGDTGEIQTAPAAATPWTHRATGSAFAGNFIKVVRGGWYSTACFIALGAAGEIQRSLDGVTWLHVATLGFTGYNIAYTPDGWLVINSSGSTAARSVDGVTWEQISVPLSLQNPTISPKTGAIAGFDGIGKFQWLPHNRCAVGALRQWYFDDALNGVFAKRTRFHWVFSHDTGETYVSKILPY
jgi:hypothetical protein